MATKNPIREVGFMSGWQKGAWLALGLVAGAGALVGAEPRVVTVGNGEGVYWVDGDDVVEDGEGGAFLGVNTREETEHADGGARITEVVEDSPAAKAGLAEDDIVVSFDGHTVRGPVGLTE